MKKVTLITLFIAALPILSQAQQLAYANTTVARTEVNNRTFGSRLDKAYDAFMRGLNHPMPAIVESSMFNLLVLRIDYPELDFTTALEKLDDLSVNGANSVVRYKAYITTEFMKDPGLFLEVDPEDFNLYMDVEKADHFYVALTKAIQNQLTMID
ncbi:hypothetical protein EP331_04690 [bacterium]|nr:MAG: hypothetical protein EP331_04690 [bacterium]